jgi:hypothetical protein
MSTRKTTLFYALLIAVSSLAVGMVISSRLDLSSESSAQSLAVPPMNSAPVTGPIDAQTFRNVAKSQSPIVVNIRTETTQRSQDLSEFFPTTRTSLAGRARQTGVAASRRRWRPAPASSSARMASS